MRKLRIFIVELILVGIVVAWIFERAPHAIIDQVIPWVIFAIFWHLTIEIVLPMDSLKARAKMAQARWGRMSWIIAFAVGGIVSACFFYTATKIAAAIPQKTLDKPDAAPKERQGSLSSKVDSQISPTEVSPIPLVPKPHANPPTRSTPTEKEKPIEDLGVHSPNETTVIPPNSSAIISSHPLDVEERKQLDVLESEDKLANEHIKFEPEKLTVKDCFWLDFKSPENNSVNHSGFTIRNDKTGITTHISYAVIHQNIAGARILAFYIPFTSEAPHIAVSLATMYKQPLMDPMESSAVAKGKIATGDSEEVSSENLILSQHVFVYTENYLSPEQIIDARNAWAIQGLTVIFRGTDYLENKKLEARIKKLEKK